MSQTKTMKTEIRNLVSRYKKAGDNKRWYVDPNFSDHLMSKSADDDGGDGGESTFLAVSMVLGDNANPYQHASSFAEGHNIIQRALPHLESDQLNKIKESDLMALDAILDSETGGDLDLKDMDHLIMVDANLSEQKIIEHLLSDLQLVQKAVDLTTGKSDARRQKQEERDTLREVKKLQEDRDRFKKTLEMIVEADHYYESQWCKDLAERVLEGDHP